ncbi:YccS family putative transporter [Conservatibacter flavescens]|uniref:TIGR01666 family membrane protein n=1 Tax=Conservatibacter flavescens TaxID=28161 RepID=A0A2M8S5A5_9PAST|nr:YccS family putative transporter [Conservatibacter flavescens]PJG86278.1 TIGR01666 family membrane protein [Conservatibacter flavescens]
MNRTWLNANVINTLPIFIAVNLAAIFVWFLHISQQSMPLILGSIAGGLVDLDNRLTGRLKNIFYTLIAFSISSLAAQLGIIHGYYFIFIMTAMTFIFTMLGAVGQRYSTIAFGTLVVALYTTLTYLPETAWYLNPLMILAGTLLYSVMAICIHLIFPHRPVQENLAKSFTALAQYLDAKSVFFDPDEISLLESKQIQLAMKSGQVIQAFNHCRTALFYRLTGQNRHTHTNNMMRYYFTAQEIHEKINSSHFNYQYLAEQLKNTDLLFRIQRLLELQAQACRDIAYSLQQNKAYEHPPRLDRALLGIQQSFEHFMAQQNNPYLILHLKSLIENLQNVTWQLRHLDGQQYAIHSQKQTERRKIHAENITGLRNIFYSIKNHCTFESQLFRHAVRLSIVVFICCTIVPLFHLDRGYWILLTAVFVCQPNYSATKLRLKQRIIGTILGVVVGSLLPYFTATLEAKLGLVVLSSTLFYFFRSNNYSFSTFFITIQVLISFDIIGFDIYTAMSARIIDTLIGAVIAWFAVSYLWPDWKFLNLGKASRQAIKHDARYLLYVISQLQFGRGDDLKYRLARRTAHDSATELSTMMSNMNNEPQKYQKYLQNGFQFLKINYSLLSHIAALGAYRSHMNQLQQSTVFLAQFYPIAKKVITLLENLHQLTEEQFNTAALNIEYHLKQYMAEYAEENLNQTEFSVPMQQLNMINQLLPPLYKCLHQIDEKSLH